MLIKVPNLINEKVQNTTLDLELHIGYMDDEERDPYKHAVDHGEVISVPEVLSPDYQVSGRSQGFPRETLDKKHFIMMNEIALEVKVGDIVYFNYQVTSYGTNIVEDNGDHLILRCPYDKIYCAKRRDKLIPIGSYTLIEPVMECLDDILHPVPGQPKEKWIQIKPTPGKKYLTGTVREVGTPFVSDGEIDLEKGDVVLFRKNADKEIYIDGELFFPIRQKDIELRYGRE